MLLKIILNFSFLLIFFIALYFLLKNKKNKQKFFDFYNNLYEEIKEANKNFLENKKLYFSYSQAKIMERKNILLYI